MPNFPSLSPEPKKSSLPAVAVAAVVVGLLSGGGYWLAHRPESPAAVPASAPSPASASTSPSAPTSPPPSGEAPAATAPATPSTATDPASTATAQLPPVPSDPRVRAFSVTIRGPLESAITAAVGKEDGEALTQVVTRELVWWVKVPQELLRGDTLSVAYETREGQEPLVHAVRLQSLKLDRTVEAFRYQPPGAPFPHFYQADGTELEEQLIDGPLDSYEQITSLLKDGRRHKGVDFKTPVGTPVKATFDGVVTKRSWNFRVNGNSLEIQEARGQGRRALFLHLSELPASMRPGRQVKKGEVIAHSGNTGRSFAPHLHYQLMKGETVIDPFTSHRTRRASLLPGERPQFEQEAARLRRVLPPVALAGGAP